MNLRACVRLAIFSTLGVAAGAVPVTRHPEWHVSSLKVNVVVNSDSSLLVDETLVIPESSDPNFGLRCEIPVGDDDRWDRNYGPGYSDDNGLRVKVQRVMVDGTSVQFRLDNYLRHTYQVIARDGSALNSIRQGTHELKVIYRVTGAIRSVGADDELYWNAAGHTLPIVYDSLSVRVILPPGMPGESLQMTSYAGGRGSSTAAVEYGRMIETTKRLDGAEFSVANLRSHESLSIMMRWPQGYVHRRTAFDQYGSPYYLAPLLLLGLYLSARAYLRRNVEKHSTAPQYEPPAGLSPAALRYITRGAVDGTSVAASLSRLAVLGYIEVEARGASYVFWRTQKCDTALNRLPVEEAAIAQLMFDPSANVADAACGRVNGFRDLSTPISKSSSPDKGWANSVVLGPSDPRVNVLVGAIYTRLKPQLEGKYFTWNAWIVLLGMLATFFFGVAVVLGSGEEMGSLLFLAVWSFGFFQTFSVLIGVTLLGRQRKPIILAAVALAFAGVTLLVMRQLARDISWVPVASYLTLMVLNGVFLPLLRTPTAEGQTLLSQIRGYKLFLDATDRDRLAALGKANAPPNLPSLPYAIALDVKEPWGDALANTFASATTAL
jgi:hypothetical protein